MEQEEYKSRDAPSGGKAASVIPGPQSPKNTEKSGAVAMTDSESESEVALRNKGSKELV